MIEVDETVPTCAVFGTISGEQSGSLTRFVVGEDAVPRVMSQAEMAAELGDPFATLLLGAGVFPTTAEDVLEAIEQVVPPQDPLRGPTQTFVLGEGSQLPAGSIDSGRRSIRFLAARGGQEGPDLIISAFHPQSGLVELMAWDRREGGFNYYRTLSEPGAWVFAGNSRHALSDPTQGKGPFESHPSGNLLMKELKFPWVHWHSFKANIFEHVFPEGDPLRTHPWFTNKLGAETCEPAVVMPSIRRWTRVRFDQATSDEGVIADPARFLQQILTSATVNLISSSLESRSIGAETQVSLPATFFVDSDALQLLQLPAPPAFTTSGARYLESLQAFQFRLTDGETFSQPGDAHFAFVVPERAFEDVEVLRQAISRGLVSDRLAAALLMVDFPNPVFSARRAALLAHAPASATIQGGASTYSEEMAARILAAAEAGPAGGPEAEFAARWAAGDAWRAEFATLLQDYYSAIQQRLGTQDGLNDYLRLAEARKNHVRSMPISESHLLFPQTNIGPGDRAMQMDGTVADLP